MTPRSLVDNSADAQQVKKARKAEKGQREQQIREMQQVLATPQGKRVLWRLLERCGVYKTSISTDPYATYYNEGERNIGLYVMAEINEANPQALLDMTVMAKADREVAQAEAAPDSTVEDDDDGN